MNRAVIFNDRTLLWYAWVKFLRMTRGRRCLKARLKAVGRGSEKVACNSRWGSLCEYVRKFPCFVFFCQSNIIVCFEVDIFKVIYIRVQRCSFLGSESETRVQYYDH